MATFTEQRILKQVTILPSQNAINVQWVNQILKDGIVISETFDRKAYMRAQDAEFAIEVDGADSYLAALGWNGQTIAVTSAEIISQAHAEITARKAATTELEAAQAANEQAKNAADAVKAQADASKAQADAATVELQASIAAYMQAKAIADALNVK